MAAEVQVLVLGFDFASMMKDLVYDILKRKLSSEEIIDSKTAFNILAKDVKQRRLQIYILALKQSFDIGKLNCIAWIPRPANSADSLTKSVLTTSFPL